MCKIRNIPNTITIANGPFAGDYTRNHGSVSWYLNGSAAEGEIHFTVNGDPDEDLNAYHLTRVVQRINVGIWYKRGVFNNVNRKPLPTAEKELFNAWWFFSEADCNAAALEFWNAARGV